ncbi:hypothetical protein E0W68_13675 [Flavobacterium salilacus subsp. salilacus]|uniref:hypothetical protein n=1 Tax=Flavobacterium TaxID=237 RepID=UPI0010755540|nr:MULTISPECIES: hypothetical protein [Flavobacterium]KAF2514131.1 hypothetical protein E0W68_13675 [Flavobacterium salilacus subsp. salilacus]MBE1615211.1 hypothetical protein [Flavobacterium sp. SaA2.13]
MKKYSILFCMIVLLSCSSSTNNTIMEEDNNNPILIAQGWLGYNSVFEQQNMVITNSDEWEALLTAMQGINENVLDTFTETTIDFESYTIIAAFDIKNSTTSVNITSVEENDSTIVVNIDNLQQGITQDVAHPYHIVKIKKSNKPIVFQ